LYLLVGGTANTKTTAEKIPANKTPKNTPEIIGYNCFFMDFFGGCIENLTGGLSPIGAELSLVFMISIFCFFAYQKFAQKILAH